MSCDLINKRLTTDEPVQSASVAFLVGYSVVYMRRYFSAISLTCELRLSFVLQCAGYSSFTWTSHDCVSSSHMMFISYRHHVMFIIMTVGCSSHKKITYVSSSHGMYISHRHWYPMCIIITWDFHLTLTSYVYHQFTHITRCLSSHRMLILHRTLNDIHFTKTSHDVIVITQHAHFTHITWCSLS